MLAYPFKSLQNVVAVVHTSSPAKHGLLLNHLYRGSKFEFKIHKHVALRCRQMVASWTTANKTANPIVQFGTQSGKFTTNVTATFDQYTKSDMCGGIANTQGWADPGKQPNFASIQ